jgi:UDP-N-acetylmuramoyl-tripeptide--D-alanyl-D-alanine ligase
VASVTRGAVVRRGAGAAALGVAIDSRAVTAGGLFVALRGESHDGHAFAPAAARAGAAILLVERGRGASLGGADLGLAALIEVDDTLVALGELARAHLEAWRESGRRRVVAITGSAGKTTTKELTAALLSAVGPTHFTAGNLNNRVGVPMVVLELTEAHRFLVLEMGMSLPGELAAITGFARPDVALVTNVGLAHAEGVGGLDGVMREKGAVYRALEADGCAVVNADDARVVRASEGTRATHLLGFGKHAQAAYRLVRRVPRGAHGSLVTLATPTRELELHLPLPGEVAALDLAAALAAQESASGELLSPAAIDDALASVHLEGRATTRLLGGDVLVVDDTYNANPASMRSALATLADVAEGRRRVAVVGEMRELGAHAEAEHRALGDALAGAGLSLVIGCGGLVSLALARAAELGVAVVDAASTAAAAREAVLHVAASDAVLVKGSRGVQAEAVVAALTEAWPSQEKSAGSLGR